MRLIHITDPHLSSLDFCRFSALRGKRWSGYLSWRRKRRHVHRPEILDRLVESAAAERPDQLLLTGDLVHIGLEREVAQAAEWLAGLAPPDRLCFVPGNHDLYAPDSLLSVRRHWGDYLPSAADSSDPHDGFPYTRDIDSVRLVGVNSAVPTPIFSARGRVGTVQSQALPGLLDPQKFNILLIHHPPFPGMTRRRKALADDRALERILADQPADLVLHGHTHRNCRRHHGTARVFGTASASSRMDASYRVFDVTETDGAWTVRMQLKSLGSGSDTAFRVVDTEEWRLRR